MLREIACDVADIVMSSGYVNTHFEFAKMITDGDRTYPVQYLAGGQTTPVLDNDVNGCSYLRLNGEVSFGSVSGADAVKIQACGGTPFIKMNTPLRLVLTIPRSKLRDDAFSDVLLAQEIISLLYSSTFSLDGVRSFEYVLNSYSIDGLSIWTSEVKNVDHQMNFNFAYIAINFTASAVVNPACLIRLCDEY